MNGYGIFLMIELARILGVIPKKLEYDLTWEKGEELHNEFDGSKFNDTHKGEYECIEEFLKDYRKRNIENIIPLAPLGKKFVYSVENHRPIEVSANVHNRLIEDDYIHFNGRDWVYFDSDYAYVKSYCD